MKKKSLLPEPETGFTDTIGFDLTGSGTLDMVPVDEEPEIYVGAFAFDPAGRLVKIVEVLSDDEVVTQIVIGSYCAKTRYAPSVLRAWRTK